MGFKANNAEVRELFNRSVYLIPRNQRKYVWNQRNWQELFEDVNIVAEDGKQPPHFIGSIVLKDEGREQGISRYNIIDGQQRIITLTIFLSSIMYMLKIENLQDDFDGTKQYVVAKNDKNIENIMVVVDNYASFENIIEGILNMETEILQTKKYNNFFESLTLDKANDSPIVSAFIKYVEYIKSKLDEKSDKHSYLIKLRDALINIKYVSIIATTEEDSYTIFEILNARGLALEDHELLKNYIMRFIQPENNRDRAKTLWSNLDDKLGKYLQRFIKHYSVHRFRYDKDLSPYKTIQKSSRGKNTYDLLKDIIKKSDYYYKIVNPSLLVGEHKSCSPIEFRIYSFFKKRRQEQLRPILLSLIHCLENEKISEKLYEKVLIYLYDFFICYNLIGKQNSNKLSGTINKYAYILENDYSYEVLRDFLQNLQNKLPSEENFINLFKDIGWSHHENYYCGEDNKEKAKIVLEVFEYHLSGIHNETFSIEHIIPDSEGVSSGSIGNLIPLELNLNARCFDKPLIEKLQIYEESKFSSTRKLAKRIKEQQGNFDIQKRTAYLAKIFYESILNFNPPIYYSVDKKS